jgi:hypothetical protein
MELVRNAARGQQLIQHLRALLEAEVVVVAHIEINLQALETGGTVGAREGEDIVAIEVSGRTEDQARPSSCPWVARA